MELGVFLISLAGGIGLSSACGFRVFVPPLLMSLASILGILDLNGDLAWMGTIPALILFAFATVIEIGSYYIPWVDNMLDTIASPAAVIVGILVSSAVIEADSDLIRWTAAIVLGGGSAGMVQSGTVFTRGISTTLTGGAANSTISTIEATASLIVSILAIIAQLLVLLVLVGIFYYMLSRRSLTREV